MTQQPDEVLDPTATGPEQGVDPESTDVHADMTAAMVVRPGPYDVEVPATLRERLAYARALSASGILPRDYASKPANVLVAGEMGRELGLSTVQSVLMLNVVEGRPTLGASGVRAVVLRAGHRIKVTDRAYSANGSGVPVLVTVTGTRWNDNGDEETDSRTYTLDMAARAGLCRVIKDDAGLPTDVRARSRQDNPLPWELHTERMLEARATTWLGDTMFADVTMGLAVEREPEGTAIITTAEQVPTKPTARAEAVLQQVKPTRRTDLPDEYDPAADVALFPDGDWWTAAGAQVSRRNAAQLAADRIAKWCADHPDDDTVPRPPTEPDPEVTTVCDYPACVRDQHRAGDHMDENGDVLVPEPERAEPPVDPVPSDPEPEVVDLGRMGPADDPVPDDVPGDDGPVVEDPPTDDAPDLGGDAGMAATAAELLAEIDAAADEYGKSRQGLMVRWIASHRKNPEDASAEELEPFVVQLRETLAARRG